MKRSTKTRALHLLLRIYLIFFSILIIFPLTWAITTSFKTNAEFFQNPFSLPGSLQFANYSRAWAEANIGLFFNNSLYISIVVVLLLLIIGSMAAYASTRLKLKIGSIVRYIFMVSLFIPTILCIATMFQQLQKIRLLDQHIGLILLYIAAQIPFTVFVLSGFFMTLPHEMEEAAYIDGSGLFRTFWNIMLPLAKPGIATVSIFAFLGTWNEYVLARTMILTRTKSTLPTGMVQLMSSTNYGADWVALFAGLVIVMIPTIAMYMVFQKYITSGMTAGAIKG